MFVVSSFVLLKVEKLPELLIGKSYSHADKAEVCVTTIRSSAESYSKNYERVANRFVTKNYAETCDE